VWGSVRRCQGSQPLHWAPLPSGPLMPWPCPKGLGGDHHGGSTHASLSERTLIGDGRRVIRRGVTGYATTDVTTRGRAG
jgi:hypothetical protein